MGKKIAIRYFLLVKVFSAGTGLLYFHSSIFSSMYRPTLMIIFLHLLKPHINSFCLSCEFVATVFIKMMCLCNVCRFFFLTVTATNYFAAWGWNPQMPQGLLAVVHLV